MRSCMDIIGSAIAASASRRSNSLSIKFRVGASIGCELDSPQTAVLRQGIGIVVYRNEFFLP